MGRQKISQREALRLRKRVTELERAEADRVKAYLIDYPGGVHLDTIDLSATPQLRGRLQGATKLGAALVAKCDGERLNVFGVLPKGQQ